MWKLLYFQTMVHLKNQALYRCVSCLDNLSARSTIYSNKYDKLVRKCLMSNCYFEHNMKIFVKFSICTKIKHAFIRKKVRALLLA